MAGIRSPTGTDRPTAGTCFPAGGAEDVDEDEVLAELP
jgi:hypothetical protein